MKKWLYEICIGTALLTIAFIIGSLVITPFILSVKYNNLFLLLYIPLGVFSLRLIGKDITRG